MENRLYKKVAVFCASLLIFSSIIAGCGSSNTSGTSTTGNAAAGNTTAAGSSNGSAPKQTLTVMISSGNYGPEALKSALSMAGGIMGVNVKFNVFPDAQMLDVVNTKLATGNADDIIVHNFGVTDVDSKALAALDGPWTSKITDTTRPLCVSTDGKTIIKAPFAGEGNMGMLYNKQVLQEAGVTLPIKNYQELIDACAKIKAKNITPFEISNKEVWTAQILLLASMSGVLENTPGLVDQLITNKVKPQDVPQLVKIFDNALSLKTKGYINSDYMSVTDAMAQAALVKGKAAFYCQLDSAYGGMSEQYPDQVGNIGMTYVPLWDDAKDGYVLFSASSNYLSAVAASPNVEQAKQFINTFLTQPVLTAYYKAAPGSVPYSNLGYDLDMSPWNQEMRGYAKTMKVEADFANAIFDGQAKMSPFYGRFNEQIQAMYAGASVADTLDAWYKAYAQDAQARKVAGF